MSHLPKWIDLWNGLGTIVIIFGGLCLTYSHFASGRILITLGIMLIILSIYLKFDENIQQKYKFVFPFLAFVFWIPLIFIVPTPENSHNSHSLKDSSETDSVEYWFKPIKLDSNIVVTARKSFPPPKNLRDLFVSDFPSLSTYRSHRQMRMKHKITKQLDSLTVIMQFYADFGARSYFLGTYIPSSKLTFDACGLLIENYLNFANEVLTNRIEIETKIWGERAVELKDLQFSGRIYIYHEYPLFESEIDTLTKYYREQNLSPQFRSTEYMLAQLQLRK